MCTHIKGKARERATEGKVLLGTHRAGINLCSQQAEWKDLITHEVQSAEGYCLSRGHN